MDLDATLDVAREDYLQFYSTAAAALEERTPIARELLIQLNGVPSEDYRALYRADLVYREGGEARMLEINLEQRTDFEAAAFDIDGAKVTVEPLVWNGVEVRTDLASIDADVLRDWYQSAMDTLDSKPLGATRFRGVIHSFGIEQEGGAVFLSVDLGSAPVSVARDLINVLAGQGATFVELGSWSYRQ